MPFPKASLAPFQGVNPIPCPLGMDIELVWLLLYVYIAVVGRVNDFRSQAFFITGLFQSIPHHPSFFEVYGGIITILLIKPQYVVKSIAMIRLKQN